MKTRFLVLLAAAVGVLLWVLATSGCTIVQGRVMPYPAWYWSKEAKYQRECAKGLHNSPYKTNSVPKITNPSITPP